MDACFFLLTDDSNISQPSYNRSTPQLLPWSPIWLLSLKKNYVRLHFKLKPFLVGKLSSATRLKLESCLEKLLLWSFSLIHDLNENRSIIQVMQQKNQTKDKQAGGAGGEVHSFGSGCCRNGAPVFHTWGPEDWTLNQVQQIQGPEENQLR